MKKRTVFRVLPITEGGKLKGWEVRKGKRWVRTYDKSQGWTKPDAVSFARRRALDSQPSKLVVHKRDGQIQYESTFPRSSDPRRSKG